MGKEDNGFDAALAQITRSKKDSELWDTAEDAVTTIISRTCQFEEPASFLLFYHHHFFGVSGSLLSNGCWIGPFTTVRRAP